MRFITKERDTTGRREEREEGREIQRKLKSQTSLQSPPNYTCIKIPEI